MTSSETSPLRDPPTPDANLGRQALQILLRQRSVLPVLGKMHERLGNVLRIPLGGFSPVLVAGPRANHFVLVEARDRLRWRIEGDPVSELLRQGLLMQDGVAHDELRRRMSPPLHRTAVRDYVGTMVECAEQMLEAWPDGGSLDMLVEMRKVTLRILTRTLFAVDIGPELGWLWRPLLRLLDYISPGLWLLWRGAPRPGYAGARAAMDEYLYRIIRERRAQPAGGQDLLSLLAASSTDDGLIRDQLLTMLIAGHDTSTALLSWALHLLAMHREAQTRVKDEVDRVLGSRPPTAEKLDDLVDLDRVLKETLRLFPPIHLGNRLVADDLEFDGYRIPAGSRLIYSIYLTHRDPSLWPHPSHFEPDRFAVPDRSRSSYSFLPFGGGPRSCIGSHFGLVESKVVLARIFQRFEVESNGRPVRPHMGATLEPRPGVEVRVRRRQRP